MGSRWLCPPGPDSASLELMARGTVGAGGAIAGGEQSCGQPRLSLQADDPEHSCGAG